MNDQFYQKVLMDHFKNPRHKKKVEPHSFSSGKDNPSCGDKISVSGMVKDNIIVDVGFEGSGCVVSLATASLLMEEILGKTVDQVLKLTKDDILKIIGLQLGPNRLRCALLSLEALQRALMVFIEENKKN